MDNILYGHLAHVSGICNGTIILDLSWPKEKWERKRARERQKFWPAYKQKVESFVKSLRRLEAWANGFGQDLQLQLITFGRKKKVKPGEMGNGKGMNIRIHFIIHFIAQRTEQLTDWGSDGLPTRTRTRTRTVTWTELNMQNSWNLCRVSHVMWYILHPCPGSLPHLYLCLCLRVCAVCCMHILWHPQAKLNKNQWPAYTEWAQIAIS